MTYVTIGSISEGTMRPEDLIPTFASELDRIRDSGQYAGLVQEAYEAVNDNDCDSEDAGFILDDLLEALNEYAPPMAYFGAHEGDGASYGFWISNIDTDDAEPVPGMNEEYQYVNDGEHILHVNDHGNATLYEVGLGREVWSVV
jgi:hypothetical protein